MAARAMPDGESARWASASVRMLSVRNGSPVPITRAVAGPAARPRPAARRHRGGRGAGAADRGPQSVAGAAGGGPLAPGATTAALGVVVVREDRLAFLPGGARSERP